MRRLNKITRNLLTLGPIGYLKAPGTMATLCTLPFVYLFDLTGPLPYTIITIILASIAFILITLANKCVEHDPCEVVIDEFIGCLFTFIAIKINLKTIFLGFILFRLFDITKPLGIKKIEKLNGASGILFDDIAAGILSNVLLQIFIC